MSTRKVSIIIPNYNGKHYLDFCLRSVLETDYPNLEVLVVDNGSTDGSVEYVISNFSKDTRVKVIVLDKNYGYPAANNIGAKQANGKYLVFLNNDTKVDKGWLKELVQVFELDRSVGMAQGKVLLMRNPRRISNVGHYIDKLGFTYDRGRFEKDEGQYDHITQIAVTGVAAIIRREVFEKLSGFDSSFFLQLEDSDLSWRVQLYGLRTILVPQAIIYHVDGGTLYKRDLAWRLPFWIRNQFFMLVKNYSLTNTVLHCVVLTIIYSSLALFFLLRNKGRVSISIIKGMVHFIRKFKTAWKKRFYVQYIRRVSDRFLFSHFLRTPNFRDQYTTRYQRMLKQIP